MRIEPTGPGAFWVEFDSPAELAAVERSSLAVGGLLLPATEALPSDTLLAPPPLAAAAAEPAPAPESPEAAEEGASAPGSLWEQLRRMTPPQKMLLAPKADRFARALLVQDSDPQVLFALLKNPRLSLDEVLRVAKSSFLSFQAAELILKTNPWFANLDVRVALIRNPKLPTPSALRILPTLPDNEVRAIAKGAATSMPLKQAALKRIVGS